MVAPDARQVFGVCQAYDSRISHNVKSYCRVCEAYYCHCTTMTASAPAAAATPATNSFCYYDDDDDYYYYYYRYRHYYILRCHCNDIDGDDGTYFYCHCWEL